MAKVNQIKVVLIEKENTNKRLSESLAKTHATISKCLRHSSNPFIDIFLKIAQILKVHPDDLFTKQINQQLANTF